MQDICEKEEPRSPISEYTIPGTITSELHSSYELETDTHRINSRPHESCLANPKDSETPSFWNKQKTSNSYFHLVSSRFSPSLTLENSGSVARDHLAVERTFLSYVRTSLLSASTGVALIQLYALSKHTSNGSTPGHIPRYARPIGAAFVIFGLAILILGVHRYFLIQRMLTKGLFPATQLPVAGVSFVAAAITIIIFGVLVSARFKWS